MGPFQIRTLQSSDAELLLKFEMEIANGLNGILTPAALRSTHSKASPTMSLLVYPVLITEPGIRWLSKILEEI